MAERGGTIREATLADAEGLVALDQALARDGRGMVLDVEQVLGLEERRKQIDDVYRSAAAGEANAMYVADAGGTVAGSAELRQLRPARCRHVGILSLGVHPDHQRRGFGRALMEALIEHARVHGLERLELYVRADNERALALYRSLGFTREGTRARFVRLPDGGYVDDHVMARFL